MDWFAGIVFGCGGPSPGVVAYGAIGAAPHRVLTLPDGHSVYAAKGSGDGRSLVIGTKRGVVLRLSVPPATGGLLPAVPEVTISQLFDCGTPLLSATFAGEETVGASDAGGRLVLCPLADGEAVREIRLFRPVCALTATGWNALAGVTATGEILVWEVSSGWGKQRASGPPPAEPWALVRLVHWPAAKCLVYPGRTGELVRCSLPSYETRAVKAHYGDWCAMHVCGDHLVTVGRRDGRLRLWNAKGTGVAGTLCAPPGVVAVVALDDLLTAYVMITEDGEAGVFEVAGRRLQLVARLKGNCYRTVVIPKRAVPRLSAIEHDRAKAETCVDGIRMARQASDEDSAERLHRSLVSMGYGHVSQAVLAEQAQEDGDLLGELRHRFSLWQTVREEPLLARLGAARYAEILMDVWQVEEAMLVSRQTATTADVYGTPSTSLAHAQKCSQAMQTGAWLATPGVAVATLIDAATTVGRLFFGRWTLRQGGRFRCPDTNVNGRGLHGAYERLRRSQRRMGIAAARLEQVWILTRVSAVEESVVTISSSSTPGLRLQLCLRLEHEECQTSVIPLVLFSAVPKTDTTASPLDWNTEAREGLSRMGSDAAIDAAFRGTLEMVECALREIVTAARAHGWRQQTNGTGEVPCESRERPPEAAWEEAHNS